MGKKYFLMLKHHNITGMKYLCFHWGTRESCFIYKGSGSYWKNHLLKHGRNIITTILDENEDRTEIIKSGKHYSELWDIVKSKQFANLVIEDAGSTAEGLRRPETIKKRANSFKHRMATKGFTELEIIRNRNTIKILRSPEVRKKAQKTFSERLKRKEFTQKELQAKVNMKERIRKDGFTLKEIERNNKVSPRQLGKSMRERLGDPTWVNPLKGKTGKEIHGEEYIHPRQGKILKIERGNSYIDPKSKPFKLIINGNAIKYYTSESDFMRDTNLTSPMLCKLKRNFTHIIKRQSNSRHDYNTGDTIEYIPLTIEEYKLYVSV